MQVRNSWDAKTIRDADLPETHNKRMQPYQMPATQLFGADARRYERP
jgi:hypothetical protein